MVLKTILLCAILTLPFSAIGQCPDGPSFRTKLDHIAVSNDNGKMIGQLLDLVKQARKCRLQDSTMAQMLHVLGRTLWYNNQLDSAIILTRQAIALNSTHSKSVQPANLCHSYFNLASIHMQQGDLLTSLDELDKAITHGKKYKAKLGSVADAYCQKASIRTALGDYEETVSVAEQAYRYALGAGRSDLVAKSLMEKAQGLIELDSLGQAESALSKALFICQRDQHRHILGSIYSLTAELKRKKDLPEQVVKFYLSAFDAYKEIQFDYGCAQSAENLGYYYEKNLRSPEKALHYYQIALKYADTDIIRALLYSHIGSVYGTQKKYTDAQSFHQRALNTAGLQVAVGNIHQNPSAKVLSTKLDKTALLMVIQGKATSWLEAARMRQNDPKALSVALATFALADTLVDQMRREHTGRTSKLFWREHTRELYESAIETCYLLNNPEKALYFFEKSRAVLLNDQINESGAAAALSPTDRQRESQLKGDLRVLQTSLHDAREPALSAIREKLLVKQEEFEKFIKTLEKSNPHYYAYKFNTQIPTLAEIREKMLGENQMFISYFSGEKAMYGLLVDRKTIQLRKLKDTGFSETLGRFQHFLANRETQNQALPQYLNQAHQIYLTMVQPFHLAPGMRVIVSPDGTLIPFQALSKSPTRPEYLINDHAFSYTYSAGYLMKTRRDKPQLMNFKNYLGFAPVNFYHKSNQPDLPASDLAMKRIAKPLTFPKILTRTNATKATFNDQASDYRIVQLLTHAEADSAQLIPRIYFADASLSLNELPEGRPWRTQLLVLSACRTGVGKNQRGEGIFSLARGFAGLGIPSVLTTLWSVENEPVYNMTEHFFEELSKDLPLDVAMQKAQLQQLQTTNRASQLPYSWAGLALIGNTAPISPGILQNPWLAIIPGALLLIFLVWFLTRR